MIDNIEMQAKLLFNLKLNILEAGGMEAFHLQRHWKGKKIKLSEKYSYFSVG